MPTDNSSIKMKINLRRHFLGKYGVSSVLDLCQGDGHIWRQLRTEYPEARYVGYDRKPKNNRVSVEAKRIAAVANLEYDCVDVDVYGEPWEIYSLCLKNIKENTTFFLTWGKGSIGASNISGIARSFLNLPNGVPGWLLSESYYEVFSPFLIWKLCPKHLDITEVAWYISENGRAAYFGVRVERKKQ